MSGDRRITLLDFTKGRVSWVLYADWLREQHENCRAQGHVFASSGVPAPGQRCICGDVTYPPGGATEEGT